MDSLFMVISKTKNKQVKEKFNNYDEAFNKAVKESRKGSCSVILLELNFETRKWIKRLTLSPSETC